MISPYSGWITPHQSTPFLNPPFGYSIFYPTPLHTVLPHAPVAPSNIRASLPQVLLLVADANGRSGGPEALELLENAGFVNLVGVIGGFSAFWRVFDAKLAR